MQPPSKRWFIADPLTEKAERELQEYHPILRQILYNRGVTTAEAARQYVLASPPAGSNPENLSNMTLAVERLVYASEHQEPMAV